jgi:glycosyltransferase involved in cell wall biosynthesis
MKKVIIITPTFNEEINISNFILEVENTMSSIAIDYDHLIIDNSSTDRTQSIIKEIAKKKKNLKAIFNLKNFGWARSIYHALMESHLLLNYRDKQDNVNYAVILISADFQEPISLIPEFINSWSQSNKIILGKKITSEENKFKFLIRKLFYKLFNCLSENKINENVIGFGLYDQIVLQDLKRIQDPYPFLKGLISELGYEIKLIEYHQPSRKFGKSKISLLSLYDIAMTGIVKHSKLPLRLMTILGFSFSFFSLIIALVYLIFKILFWNTFAIGIAPLIIGLFFLGFLNIFLLGLIGEYILVILSHSRNIPYVFEKEKINF